MAAAPKLTPWFKGEKPTRPGWYDTCLDERVVVAIAQNRMAPSRRHWDGETWSMSGQTGFRSLRQDWLWRGLANKPRGM